jgi:hypothetical protein
MFPSHSRKNVHHDQIIPDVARLLAISKSFRLFNTQEDGGQGEQMWLHLILHGITTKRLSRPLRSLRRSVY